MSQSKPPRSWKNSVVYQIYPRSFCDSNGDGIGDLNGITSRLDYLQNLGIDVVWLSPVYASPNDDNGYDISDYRAISPEYGNMADFDAMLAAMHACGIRLMMDLVVNHTSDEHPWFVQARQSRDNPWHDYYLWCDPKPDGSPPTNWEAAFNGSVWEFNAATGEYYLHMFSKKQPDLNWENPAVRAEVHALMRFWLDKGVDGFRMDVINMISKPWAADGSLPDAPVVRDGVLQPSFAMTCNSPRLNEFLTEMRREVLDHYDTITVGEAPLASVQQGREITHPETGSLNMLFQFEHMDLDSVGGHVNGKWARKPLDWRDMSACMARWQTALQDDGWNSLYLCNHDQPRSVSRFGDDGVLRVTAAKALATWLHGMQGTPFVYQGEELGMTNVAFASISEYRDIETLNFYRVATTERGLKPADAMASIHAVSRDNARTPMQWSAADHAGFSSAPPWIAVNPNHAYINAQAAQADPDSVFHYYRQLIALRKQLPVLVHGRFEAWTPSDPQIVGYLRHWGELSLFVICNMGKNLRHLLLPEQLATRAGQCILSNLPVDDRAWQHQMSLRAFEAHMWLLR
ncbi:MAG: alpha-glucosidase [Rhodoferax sp.]|jgi:oligo-1,6-glucosidase|uniref:alpha-glucosidase n=1 Tax=Rhodoferax sp. TaxID=50421 RepID=UPI001B503140|nr:alpha-glucosidase [Rhodoferax sp.]MBP9147181.1 alpha-glucosidase [Rhodoferax sp.]MBP9734167.1 alpha-glucosidase [Rhodoferax sp.]